MNDMTDHPEWACLDLDNHYFGIKHLGGKKNIDSPCCLLGPCIASWIRIRIRIRSSWIRIRIQENRGGFGFSWIRIRGVWIRIRIRIRDAWIRTSLV